ncbi:MAG: DUF4919 domain-containing protein [Flavobacteriales bacterium]|nr:DUF4919 domain-containing protein [Flavobacteriales bacterium]MCB9198261.1 DUF4919 domain-containing protein [Flavobacteriales bacterium]
MNHIRLYLVILFNSLALFLTFSSQRVLSVDLGKINEITSDISSQYYYPSLLIRYQNFDTTLTSKEFHFLYYGQYFQSFYRPSEANTESELMFQFIKMRTFETAIDYGLKSFEKHPLDLKTIFGLYICYDRIGNEDEAGKYQMLYFGIVAAILETGDGKTPHTAFIVMNISDEYEIISSLEKEIKKYKLIGLDTELFKLKGTKNLVTKKIKKLYFNIHIPLMKSM